MARLDGAAVPLLVSPWMDEKDFSTESSFTSALAAMRWWRVDHVTLVAAESFFYSFVFYAL